MMDVDNLAIVIIGRNEGERLKKCIASVISSNAKIIYVDSNSVDGSLQYAEGLGIDVVDLSDVRPLNASVARNAGYQLVSEKFADKNYIHFIDADCELEQGWLDKACSMLDSHDDVAVVCGRLREKYP